MPVPAETTSMAAPSTQSLLCGLLRRYMGLAIDQCVVYNQKWLVPPDDRLYLTVSSLGPQRAYGATVETFDGPGGGVLLEEIAIPTQEMIGIDLYSRSQEAVDRKEELLMTLASTFAQQLCEQYAMKMARIPMTFADLSGLEGTSRLNRFHLAFAVLRTRSKVTVIEYYDAFSTPALVIEP